MLDKDKKIGIIGLGLLGGSYAQGLSGAGFDVCGVDIDEKAVEKALQRGWISKGGPDPSILKDRDIVISALYPQAFVKWIAENQEHLKSDSILTDVTGIKKMIIAQIDGSLRKDVEYIACHPMAGRESRGIDYADASQFEQANFIIVATEKNSDEAKRCASDLAETLKFRKVSYLDPDTHDRIIGFVSQLCHVIAISLMNIGDDPSLVDYTGDSFRDLTRIADINEELWPELFIGNKENLIEEIDRLVNEMEQMKDLIEREDILSLKEKMVTATIRRRGFDKKKKA